MSFAPGLRIGEVKLKDQIFPISYPGYNSVAVDASDGAENIEIPKRMLDTWAVASQRKWAAAQQAGRFSEEITPIMAKKGREKILLTVDEGPRPDSTLAAVEQLPTVFGAKTTTAGNAPGLNDGASAMVVMTEQRARELRSEAPGNSRGGCRGNRHAVRVSRGFPRLPSRKCWPKPA